MLFDKAIDEKLTRQLAEFRGIDPRRTNLWRDDWDAPLELLRVSLVEAEKDQTPMAWRTVTVHGRMVRTAMASVEDGTEHPLYVSITKLTDTAEQGLEAVQKAGREVYSEELALILIKRLERVETVVTEERAGRSMFESKLKKELDDIRDKVIAAKARLVDVTVKLENSTFALFSTGIAEVANLIRVALGLVDKHNVVEKIKAAGRQVYDATGRFLSDVRARVAALKLPWTKSAAEGYFEPSPGIPVKVRAGGVDREERRIPGGGKPFADWFEFEGKRYDAPELVVVPAGTFDMGSTPDQIAELKRRYPSVDAKWFDAEGPLRKAVRVPAPFAIGRFAVTRGQFAAFQRDTGHRMDGGAWGWSGTEVKHDPKKNWQAPGFTQDETHPAVGISHLDATAYCQWLSKNTGKSYRLPTETEWEYACRAGTRTWFWWGDEISAEQANYDSNFAFGAGKQAPYRERTVPVESFKPNPWSLWQVHGNVLEWCQDHWHDSYAGAPHDSGAWPDGDKSLCVLRGGSWYSDPPDTRAADRDRSQPVDRSVWSGFRVARTL